MKTLITLLFATLLSGCAMLKPVSTKVKITNPDTGVVASYRSTKDLKVIKTVLSDEGEPIEVLRIEANATDPNAQQAEKIRASFEGASSLMDKILELTPETL